MKLAYSEKLRIESEAGEVLEIFGAEVKEEEVREGLGF